MKLSSARAAKLELTDHIKKHTPEPELRRTSRKTMAMRAPPQKPGSIGIAIGVGITEKSHNYHVAIRTWPDPQGVPQSVLRSFLSQQKALGNEVSLMEVKYESRALQAGSSTAHFRVGKGTLGAFVRPNSNPNQVHVLSCNHVLADCDDGHYWDPIAQPSPNDFSGAGTPPIIARLIDFIPLSTNRVDAAIAVISDSADSFVPLFYDGINILKDPVSSIGQRRNVFAIGATSGRMDGQASVVEMDQVTINYRNGAKSATFDDMIEIIGNSGSFSQPGDSGALVIDSDTFEPYGLLVGGGRGNDGVDRSVAHFLPTVFEELGIVLAD